jgi:hypothetical protein
MEDLRDAVLQRLAAVAERVAVATGLRKAADPTPDDPMRGLYLTEVHIGRLIDDGAPLAFGPGALAPLEDGPLLAFGSRLGIDDVDLDLLMVAVAPDLDPRFEKLYGYLHDDVTRRRATVGLALRLAGRDLADPDDRARLAPEGALVRLNLVTVDDADRPFLTRALRVPDRVVGALLGDDQPDLHLRPLLVTSLPLASEVAGRLAPIVADSSALVYLQERPGGMARDAAAGALALAGRRAVCVDLQRLDGTEPLASVIGAAHREALLVGGGLVAGPIDALAERDLPAIRLATEGSEPIVLHGTKRWEPDWSPRTPLLLDAPVLDRVERARLWNRSLDGATVPGLDPGVTTAAFRLGPDHVVRAARSARLLAEYAGRPVSADDIHVGARSQNSAGLQRLATRVAPAASWTELILPAEPLELLQELVARIRFREQVLDTWGMRRGGGRGEGCTALFAGPSGTGKTLAAEVIAHDLGLDLYTVDLATVVDKYIGETEKNLDRIFGEAERVNGVLFFDEADALFGKRSEVKDARDRYANVEVAYLLQRMERFGGLAILATNLRANLDEAFARRLDVMVDFPQPDPVYRLKLWRHCLGDTVPRVAHLDLEFCADAFELSGGNIRNVAVTAAYLAATDDAPIDMEHLIKAVQREYRKLGRLCVAAEFGKYFPIIAATPA